VQRIFDRFCAGGSCHGIAVELNQVGILTLAGSPWHPLIIRRLLGNETSTGRTIYRRTHVAQVRDPRSGKKRRQVSERDRAEWIDVTDATPALINPEAFARAQTILQDPERRLRGQPSQLYRLRGHVVCAACGTPMVAQALLRGQYSYYRCRKSYGGKTDGTCRSRYVRAEVLEQVVFAEIAALLSQPERVLAEARRVAGQGEDTAERSRVEQSLHEVEEQQRRLVRLYTAATLPEHMLSEEGARLNPERNRLERERQALALRHPAQMDLVRIAADLAAVLQRMPMRRCCWRH
jgi:site-specific DNA recombinase